MPIRFYAISNTRNRMLFKGPLPFTLEMHTKRKQKRQSYWKPLVQQVFPLQETSACVNLKAIKPDV